MTVLSLHIPGYPPLPLEGEGRAWTFGRAAQNDIALADTSLSRHHARIVLRAGEPQLEDLGSRNGTFVNGQRITGAHPLRSDDSIQMGLVIMRLAPLSQGPRVKIDALGDAGVHGSLILPLSRLQEPATTPGTPATLHLREVIRELHALSLELLEDSPPEQLFARLLDSLWTLLSPWRAAVLILDAKAGLQTLVSRGPEGNRPILLGRSLVDAALQRREAVLFNQLGQGPGEAPESLVRSGVSSALVTPMEYRGEVKGLLYLDCRFPHPPYDEEDLRLAGTLAHLATAKLEQARVREEALAQKKLDQELSLARHIQQGLLPGLPPEIPGYEVLGNNLPSRHVSGDLFGYWLRADGKWLICLADVSGKGLGPGLLMASLQATLEAWTERDLSVSELAFQLSKTLARHTDGRRFVTAFLVLLDPLSGAVTYSNAGHNPALLLRRDGAVMSLGAHGLPLALLPGTPYGEAGLQLEAGDLLVMYTDGITETTDPAGEEFGAEALTGFLADRRAESLPALDASLMAHLDAFSQGAPYLDDRTLLMLRKL